MSAIDVNAELASLMRDDLDARLVAAVAEMEANGRVLTREDQRMLATGLAQRCLGDLNGERTRQGLPAVAGEAAEALIDDALNALFGADAFEPFLSDRTLRELRLNGPHTTFVVRTDGTKESHPPLVHSSEELITLVQALARRGSGAGGERRFDAAHPIVDMQLPGGHRLWAAMDVTGVPVAVMRRHDHEELIRMNQLGARGMFPPIVEDMLTAAVSARLNMIAAGGTGMGKTTLLRGLCNAINPGERMIVIEDSPELGLDLLPELHPDQVTMCKREDNIEGVGGISLADLARAAMRGSPDRIICGECRGHEVLPMLLAMTQGNEGSMSTVHARSSADVFSRLALYAAMTNESISFEESAALIAGALDLVVFLSPRPASGPGSSPGAVTSIREVTGREGAQVTSNEVLRLEHTGRVLSVSALQPETSDRLRSAGFDTARLAEVDRW